MGVQQLTSRIAVTEAMDTNFVSSPLTLWIALALVAIGSEGQTARDMLSFLGANNIEELNYLHSQIFSEILADGSGLGGPKVSSASGIWFDKSMPLKPVYAQMVKGIYAAEVKSVDFQTKATEVRNEVNAWAEKKTSGHIKEILPANSVNSLTAVVLANALYFKGVWQEAFRASLTKDDSFYPLKGESVQVPFMTSNEEQFIAVFPGFKVLKMPYRQGRDRRSFSMYIFLPDERNGLHNLLNKVDSDLEFLNKHLPKFKVAVGRFMIPKFRITYGIEVSEVLQQMGLVSPFSVNGEYIEMVGSPLASLLYVSEIFHKSFIEINEEGTEAASVTAVTMCCTSSPMREPPKYTDFVAHHPFVFFIREESTGVVLFVGHVLNPLLTA